jgi:hypothetical protein
MVTTIASTTRDANPPDDAVAHFELSRPCDARVRVTHSATGRSIYIMMKRVSLMCQRCQSSMIEATLPGELKFHRQA